MKTIDQIQQASDMVADAVCLPGHTDHQLLLLAGMSAALQWITGEGGESIQWIVEGRPIKQTLASSGCIEVLRALSSHGTN